MRFDQNYLTIPKIISFFSLPENNIIHTRCIRQYNVVRQFLPFVHDETTATNPPDSTNFMQKRSFDSGSVKPYSDNCNLINLVFYIIFIKIKKKGDFDNLISSLHNVNNDELSTLDMESLPIDKINELATINCPAGDNNWIYKTPDYIKPNYNKFIDIVFDSANEHIITSNNNYSVPYY